MASRFAGLPPVAGVRAAAGLPADAVVSLRMADGGETEAKLAARHLAAEPDPARTLASLAHWLSYSSWRRHHIPVSLRPSGARSSHWYMPHRMSSPRAYVE
jgi:hypothetical protein